MDVICTNLARYYQKPTIVPPLTPDCPITASPSDHQGVLALPVINSTNPVNIRVKKTIRPLPESLILDFREKLSAVDYSKLGDLPVDDMVSCYQKLSTTLVEETFPEKTITFNPNDKPWFTEKLRQLKRLRLREYSKHGKSEKYQQLVETFNINLKEAAQKYNDKLKADVLEGRRGSAYPVIKRMGERPHDNNRDVVKLPNHAAQNYTPQQSVEIIAEHFSKISQEFSPLQISSLPPNIVAFLNTPDQPIVPCLSVNAVKKRIVKAKKPVRIVPGDLPRKLVQKCSDLIAIPNPNPQSQFLIPNPNPNTKSQFSIPIPNPQSPIPIPNPDSQSQSLIPLPNPNSRSQFQIPDPNAQSQCQIPIPNAQSQSPCSISRN